MSDYGWINVIRQLEKLHDPEPLSRDAYMKKRLEMMQQTSGFLNGYHYQGQPGLTFSSCLDCTRMDLFSTSDDCRDTGGAGRGGLEPKSALYRAYKKQYIGAAR